MSARFNQQKQAGDQRAGVCYNSCITCCEKLFEALAAAISGNAQALKAVTVCRMLLDGDQRLQSKVWLRRLYLPEDVDTAEVLA
ncbi:hypothetical protein EJ02DRAFT_429178, partial [Clathrospora elynae]